MEYERHIPVAAHYLDGQSPRARGREKQSNVLEWVYRWGHSTAEILRLVSGQQANGYAKRLTEKGLLRATKTASGTPKFYYTLTESGLQEAERHTLQLNSYLELDPYRVNQQQIRHYRLTQQATITALQNGLITDFQTERMTGQADATGKKRPDVTWLLEGGKRWGVEIELSGKWERRQDQFVHEIYTALSQGEYERFCIVTDSPALEVRYRQAFESPSIPVWSKNDRGHWERINELELPAWLPKRLTFQLIQAG